MDDMSPRLLGEIVYAGLRWPYRLEINKSGEIWHVFDSRLGRPSSAKSLLALTDFIFGDRVV